MEEKKDADAMEKWKRDERMEVAEKRKLELRRGRSPHLLWSLVRLLWPCHGDRLP